MIMSYDFQLPSLSDHPSSEDSTRKGSVRSRPGGRFGVVLALALLCIVLAGPVFGQGGNPDSPTYVGTMKTAYFPLFQGQDMLVTVADLETVSPGASVEVRFFDTGNELLATVRGELKPGQVVSARLEGATLVFDDDRRTMVRVEVEASTQVLGAKPATTIERFEPGGFAILPDWKCAGPHADSGPDYEVICPGAVVVTDVVY